MYFDVAPATRLPPHRAPKPVNLIMYVNERSRELGHLPADIRGPSRRTEFVAVRRFIASDLAAFGYSLKAIGRALGGRHHTSVLWMLRGGRPESRRRAA